MSKYVVYFEIEIKLLFLDVLFIFIFMCIDILIHMLYARERTLIVIDIFSLIICTDCV